MPKQKKKEWVDCPEGTAFDSVAKKCKPMFEAYTFDEKGKWTFLGKGTKTRLRARIPKGATYCFIPVKRFKTWTEKNNLLKTCKKRRMI